MAIYANSIPAQERQPLGVIEERVEKKKERLFISLVGDEVTFMSLLWPLHNLDFVLLDYLAVKERCRNKGTGSEFLRRIPELPGVGGKTVVLEVEHPDYGDDRENKRRRVAFYRANGAKELKGLVYMLPPLSGNLPVEMLLMMLSGSLGESIQGCLVKKVIVQIYEELYSRGSDDPLLNSFIGKIPHTVALH